MTTTSHKGNAALIVIVFLATATIVLAVLWLCQSQMSPTIEVVEKVVEKPVEVVKEVQVEKIREVPKEVVVTKEVEVPARLTDAQQAALDFASRFAAAPMLPSADDAMYKLDAVSVSVYVDDAVRKVLAEDAVRNRFELTLRQYNIAIDQKAPVMLVVYVEGIWDEPPTVLAWNVSVELQQTVTLERKGDLRKTNATIWRESSAGQSREKTVVPSILRTVQARAESFTNKYLSVQQKYQ